jgi:hypothetical protein
VTPPSSRLKTRPRRRFCFICCLFHVAPLLGLLFYLKHRRHVSETSVDLQRTKRRCVPEYGALRFLSCIVQIVQIPQFASSVTLSVCLLKHRAAKMQGEVDEDARTICCPQREWNPGRRAPSPSLSRLSIYLSI